MLTAGMAKRDISPKQGEALAGYPHYPRYNTGVHDPLYACCMYLNNDTTELVMVTLDLLFFSKKYVKIVRNRVNERCGICGKNIMISCSHTHSGPWASGKLDIESLEAGSTASTEYISFVVKQIIDVICEAKARAVSAEFGYGVDVCGAESGVGGNRRFPGGPHDPLVSVMAIRTSDGEVLGAIVNYTLHPTFIHEWSTVVTADYPCYLKLLLNEKWPNAYFGFAQGCSGNQSSRYYRCGESYDEAERVGRKLGAVAAGIIERMQWKSEIELKIVSDEIEITLRTFGSEEDLVKQVEIDTKRYQEMYTKYGKSEKREEYYLWQNANLKMLGSEDQLGYVRLMNRGVKIELLEDEAPAEYQLFKIGDVCVIGCPGEIFVEYGLYMKAMAGFGTVIVNELTNGCLPGYLYTPESLVTGGYETDTSMLDNTFGRRMMDTVLELAQKL